MMMMMIIIIIILIIIIQITFLNIKDLMKYEKLLWIELLHCV